MRRIAPRGLFLAAGAVLVAGCSSLAPLPTDSSQAQPLWRQHQAQLAAIGNFELRGRIAERGLSGARGDLDWTQAGPRFDLRVSGPLGVGALLLSGTADAVEIRTKDGVFQTGDPTTFMQQQLGWSLPVARLRWWVLGLPAPDGTPQLVLDALGRAASLRQDGWQIDYAEYQSVGALPLPRKIELADGEHRLLLVIDRWDGVTA